MSFTYDDNGIRTSKTINGVTHTYQLNGSQIVSESWGDKLLVYLYDASGAPIGMMYRTTNYAVGDFDVFWYEKNLQGDIVAVYNETGTKVAAYTYIDAWGNHSVSYTNGGNSTGAIYNPFRYRGYYYDADLGMYYLQSRYYDSKICRFINADGYASTGQGLTGNNMFAYCGNNPVNRVDPTGEIWRVLFADDILQLALLTLCVLGIVWLIQDATGDQKLGNLFSDIVTQTAEAVDNFVDGIKSFSDSKADEKEKVDPNPPSGTVIYRRGGWNPANLTPSSNDVAKFPTTGKGLSFVLTPEPGCVQTTIEEINATGILYAVIDGPNHVSVFPVGTTIAGWHDAGTSSIWTKTLRDLVKKYPKIK